MIDPKFEPTARRIRARAATILAGLPIEDPATAWARRAALLAEIHGSAVDELKIRTTSPRGMWRWHPEADRGPVRGPRPPRARLRGPKRGRTAPRTAQGRFRPEETPR